MQPVLQILLAGGIMLAIAVVFGIILVICSNVFAVRRDERIDRVESLLAKSNCGGCGKAGCAQFAEALVKGEVKLSDCRATPAANKQKIAEILGGGDIGEETVAVVHCNGGDACYNKYDYQGYGDCASCEMLAGGVKACPVGCIGKKTCVNVCPYGAVSVGTRDIPSSTRKSAFPAASVFRTAPKISFPAFPNRQRCTLPVPITARARTSWSFASTAVSGAGAAKRPVPRAPLP